MAVHGPYHASHLHCAADVKNILGSSNRQIAQLLGQYRLRFSIISTSTGSWFDKDFDATKLLTAVVNDILVAPLRLEEVMTKCGETAVALKSSKCIVLSCGPTNLQDMFVAAFKQSTDAEVILHEDSGRISSSILGQSPSNPRRPKLAIVGMAGRFPNAADHEKFWDLLEAGLDVHRKVVTSATLPLRSFYLLNLRFRKIASTRRGTLILQARLAILVILHTDVSSMNQAFSTHGSSICLLEKLRKRIQCIDWGWPVLMKHWRWPATFQIELLLQSWIVSALSMVRQVMIGGRSMPHKTLILTSSQVG